MAAKRTKISLPGIAGWIEMGHKNREEMIEIFLTRARHTKAEIDSILSADPSSFVVEQHDGGYVNLGITRLNPDGTTERDDYP